MKYDTLIIGAGLSGLAAGIRLAYYGQSVCILERHTTIGGLNSFYRLRGRNYDVGLHAVTNYAPPGTKTGPLSKLLRQLRATGVTLYVCGQSLADQGLAADQVAPELETAVSALSVVVNCQGDGYAYVPVR